jgi:hypothetical protein
MTYYQTPPKIIRRFFSKTLIGTILLLAGFFGFTDVAIQHNQALYNEVLLATEEREKIKAQQFELAKIKYSPVVISCQAVCNKPPEKEILLPKKRLLKRAVMSKESGMIKLADSKGKPNSIRISLAQAPVITAKVKYVNGKGVNSCKGDKTRKSKKNPKGHVDTQCCLDPDEIPNPRCAY